ncbi:MAG: universal stress protein [Desulfobacteraceae bacterium]|nr:universal stress protein [Desulfobacteraceae bacterium]
MGNYSCIAVGRRGHSRVREFFMGRVCQKVVQAGKYHTEWII